MSLKKSTFKIMKLTFFLIFGQFSYFSQILTRFAVRLLFLFPLPPVGFFLPPSSTMTFLAWLGCFSLLPPFFSIFILSLNEEARFMTESSTPDTPAPDPVGAPEDPGAARSLEEKAGKFKRCYWRRLHCAINQRMYESTIRYSYLPNKRGWRNKRAWWTFF